MVVLTDKHGEFALFRCQDNRYNGEYTHTDSNNDDIIGVDSSEIIHFGSVDIITDDDEKEPDGNSYIMGMKFSARRVDTDNPLPQTNKVNNPDTGFGGTTITLNLLFDQTNSSDAIALGINKLIAWTNNDNDIETVEGSFRFGRFGIRDDRHSDLNVNPTKTQGVKIVSFDFDEDYTFYGQIQAVLVLRISGDPLLEET